MADVGRPTLYDPEKSPKQAALLCERGFTDQEIADFFLVDVRTIYRWKAEHPEFCQALKVAKDVPDERVVASLYHRAIGYEHDDVDIRAINGEIIQTPIRKHYPPDATSAIFWLKNRRPDQWRERAEPTKVELELTFKRDPERFARVVEQVEEEPDRAKALALMAGHPAEVQEHLRLVLQGVPEDQIEAVYNSAIGTILAASGRGQGEQPSQSLLEHQQIKPDVTEMGSGYMANLDDETEEEKAKLQDAVAKVEKHNAKVRSRSKKPR